MNKLIMVCALVALGFAVTTASGAAIEVKECDKCPMRMRISADGKSATINKARLMDDNPSAEAFNYRIKALIARAEKLLVKPDPNAGALTRPLMGWSTWNTFGVHISDEIVLGVARAMATNGLKSAGYTYVNIDDGFWGPRTKEGKLTIDKSKFPGGMRVVVDAIHDLGMKAGIYSDAGSNTCAQTVTGVGFYKHELEDCQFYFNELNFDFIKVDFCGGIHSRLQPRDQYTKIAEAIKATGRTDVRYNLCRWAFPGTWAADIAGSWRTTGDIRANWKSIRKLILENLYLSAYCKPGHYNDMDMLELGQLVGAVKSPFVVYGDTGLTKDEELTHFGTWCILSSPLLLGCDPRDIPQSSFEVATNPYLLAMNQNDLGLQAYVAARKGETYVLVKDADEKFGKARYVALLNLGDTPADIEIRARDLDLAGRIEVFDLVERVDPGTFVDRTVVKVPPHASKFYRFDAAKRLDRIVYEAETAYLYEYQEIHKPDDGSAYFYTTNCVGGGVAVSWVGLRETNDLVWKDVKVSEAGDYDLVLDFAVKPWEKDLFGFLQVDGGQKIRFETTKNKRVITIPVKLSAGVHTVRLSNPTSLMEDIDRMLVVRKTK